MDQYLPIALLAVLGLVQVAGFWSVNHCFGPKKKPTAAKLAPYECGIVSNQQLPQRFPVRFYLVAMIFVIFDIEIVFLYPFAVMFRQLRAFGLVEILVFAAVVFVALLYLISNGALSWGPSKRLTEAMPARSSNSTIRRISPPPIGSRTDPAAVPDLPDVVGQGLASRV